MHNYKPLSSSIILDNKNIIYNNKLEYIYNDKYENWKISNTEKISKQNKSKEYYLDFIFNTISYKESVDFFSLYGYFYYCNYIDASYDFIVNNTWIVKPIIYNDFFDDIELNHMLFDFNSFSLLFDKDFNTIYINDILLEKMKKYPKKKYNNSILHIFSRENRENNLINSIPLFKLDFIPKSIKISKFKVTDETHLNIKYSEYKEWKIESFNFLSYNLDFNCFFSEDKNQTALNVLAYDIAKNGLQKPIRIKKEKNSYKILSFSRFLISLYLNLDVIPCIIC